LSQLEWNQERAREQCALLENTWGIINEVTADLQNQGLSVAPDVYTSLRTTKSLIDLCRTHSKLADVSPREIDRYLGFCVGCCGQDVVTRVKCELKNVEDRLIIEAMNQRGKDFALRLQQRTVKAWEPLQERIVTCIDSLPQAIRVQRDVIAGYHKILEDNLSYWLAVEEDIVNSYTSLMKKAENEKVSNALSSIINDTKDHIEALESTRESLRKILADNARHTKVLEELQEQVA
jgi:bacterioferritin (cytochrome b1)